jgi:hypothetical protein
MYHGESLEASGHLDFESHGRAFSYMSSKTLEAGAEDVLLDQSMLLDPSSRQAKIPEAREVVGAMDPSVMHIVQ